MKIKNTKGFSVIEFLLIIVIVGILGGVGYYVYSSQKEPASSIDEQNTESITSNTETQDSEELETSSQTVSLGGATYTVKVPQGWTFKEITQLSDDEKLAYIIDPTGQIQLEIQILGSALTSGSVSTGLTPLKTITGVNSETYYIHGYTGSSTSPNSYELLFISKCPDKHCYTKMNDSYSLNMAIRKADLTTPVKVDDTLIDDIVTIIQSISISKL